MTLDEYLDGARSRGSIPTDAALARVLGVTPQGLFMWRRGMTHPQPGIMVRLAELAGIPPALALADRAGWQADTPAARQAADALRRIAAAALCILLLLVALPEPASATREAALIYYGTVAAIVPAAIALTIQHLSTRRTA